MADKYIRLQDAQDILKKAIDGDWEMDYAIDRLSEIPLSDMDDVQKAVRGKWMRINQYDKESNVKCSACNEEFDYIDGICYLCVGHEFPLFCPHCGAKMDLEWG